MKKVMAYVVSSTVLLALVLMLARVPGSAHAPQTAGAADGILSPSPASCVHEISVTGQGSVQTKPNEVIVVTGCRVRDPDAAAAQSKDDIVMAKVIAAIKDLGIKDEDIATTVYSLQPVYKYTPDTGEQILTEYEMLHTIAVTSHDIAMGGKILSTTTSNGANVIGSVSFGLDSATKDQLKLEAIQAAMKDARAKATTALAVYDSKIASVHSISINESSVTPTYTKAADIASSSPLESGTISISVSVSVVFDF